MMEALTPQQRTKQIWPSNVGFRATEEDFCLVAAGVRITVRVGSRSDIDCCGINPSHPRHAGILLQARNMILSQTQTHQSCKPSNAKPNHLADVQ